MKHAHNSIGDGRTLCGVANEGNPLGDNYPADELGAPPVYAEIGEYVDCPDCVRVIDFAQRCFSAAFKRRG